MWGGDRIKGYTPSSRDGTNPFLENESFQKGKKETISARNEERERESYRDRERDGKEGKGRQRKGKDGKGRVRGGGELFRLNIALCPI